MLLTIDKKRTTHKRKLTAGIYESLVVSTDFHPDYVNESALLVTYSLTDKLGREFSYKETFINDRRNDRTRDFFKYLEENGIPIDALENFCGCKEKITLKKNPRGNRVYLTIAHREFISGADGSGVITVDLEDK